MQTFTNATAASVLTDGQTIRAYDHQPMPGRPDAYVEGTVEVIDYAQGGVVIRATFDATFTNPDHNRLGLLVTVPMVSDEVSMWTYPGRVQLWG